MLLFAHTGIALGAATVIAGVANRHETVSRLASLSKYLDIRLLLVGSMLPDIIDKPVGMYLFKDTFSNGRIFSHTLLFLILLTVIGIALYRSKHQVWMLTLAAGTLVHFVLDSMWGMPGTLFWPAMGWHFSTIEVEGWVQGILNAYVSVPSLYIPEVIGLFILIWFGVTVIKRKQVITFLKTGRVS